jgi:hypothetical protein
MLNDRNQSYNFSSIQSHLDNCISMIVQIKIPYLILLSIVVDFRLPIMLLFSTVSVDILISNAHRDYLDI